MPLSFWTNSACFSKTWWLVLAKIQISTWKLLTFSCMQTLYSKSQTWLVRNFIWKSKTSSRSPIQVIQDERMEKVLLKLANNKINLKLRICRTKLKLCRKFWCPGLEVHDLRLNPFNINLRNLRINPWHRKKRRNSSNPSKSCSQTNKAGLWASLKTIAKKTIRVVSSNSNLTLFPIINWES
jgi:hypothetical protein